MPEFLALHTMITGLNDIEFYLPMIMLVKTNVIYNDAFYLIITFNQDYREYSLLPIR